MKKYLGVILALMTLLLLAIPVAQADPAEPSCTRSGPAFGPGTVALIGFDAFVTGTDQGDRIDVMWDGDDVTISASFLDEPVTGTIWEKVIVAGCEGNDRITSNDITGETGTGVQAWGDGGNDTIIGGNAASHTATYEFHGGPGNDKLIAGDATGVFARNHFQGGEGNDKLVAGHATAEDASNWLRGGAGKDICRAGLEVTFEDCEVEKIKKTK